MIGRMITKSKTLRRQSREFMKQSAEKCELWIDKYQVVKRFLVVGTMVNLYFIYNSYAKYSIYQQISQNIDDKFVKWNQNQAKNKLMVFELMKQMQMMQKQKLLNQNKQNSQNDQQNAKSKKQGKQAQKRQQNSHSSSFQKQNKSQSWFSSLFNKGKPEPATLSKNEYI